MECAQESIFVVVVVTYKSLQVKYLENQKKKKIRQK